MIDIWGVLANFLWILGLAVLLAVWSYASYKAGLVRQKVRAKLATVKYTLALDAGLLLFLVGMALTEDRGWARILWIVLAVAVTAEGVWRIILYRRTPVSESGSRSASDVYIED